MLVVEDVVEPDVVESLVEVVGRLVDVVVGGLVVVEEVLVGRVVVGLVVGLVVEVVVVGLVVEVVVGLRVGPVVVRLVVDVVGLASDVVVKVVDVVSVDVGSLITVSGDAGSWRVVSVSTRLSPSWAPQPATARARAVAPMKILRTAVTPTRESFGHLALGSSPMPATVDLAAR